jgi:polysaccharide pyruvyl transferase WcaK-like protein
MARLNKILLKGYYDFFNFGDELLLLSITTLLQQESALNEQQPELYIERQKQSIELLNYQMLPLLEFNEPIKKFVKNNKKSIKSPTLLKLVTPFLFLLAFGDALVFRVTGKAIFFKALFKFCRQLSVIHYIGGGYFTSIWDFSLQYLVYELFFIKLAKLVNPDIRVVATGLGIGPLSSKLYNTLFKTFISEFDSMYVREEISLQHIHALNYPNKADCLGDDVQLFLPLFEQYREKHAPLPTDQKIFGLNLKYDKEHDYSSLKAEINTLLRLLQAAGWHIAFFSFGTDHAVLDTIDADIREQISVHKPYEEGMDRFLKSFSKMRAGLGFAYHFSVLSALFGIPAINVYCGDYYKQKIGKVISKLSPSQKIISAEQINAAEIIASLDNYEVSQDRPHIEASYGKMRQVYQDLYAQLA